jgi:endonuclease/exonuclease/phosphatase (EEP) superfamily protein YafD
VLLLQEVSEPNLRALEPLRPLYPVRLRCGVGSSGVMVLSRLPAAAPGRCPMGGLALQPLQYRGGSVTLASVHLAWPWPFPAGQDVQFRTLRPLLATVQGPLVVGGDFNMVPWSAAVRALEREARLVRPSGLLFSHWIPALGLPLPIDHVLAGRGLRVVAAALGPRIWSDHRPVVATVAPAS